MNFCLKLLINKGLSSNEINVFTLKFIDLDLE